MGETVVEQDALGIQVDEFRLATHRLLERCRVLK